MAIGSDTQPDAPLVRSGTHVTNEFASLAPTHRPVSASDDEDTVKLRVGKSLADTGRCVGAREANSLVTWVPDDPEESSAPTQGLSRPQSDPITLRTEGSLKSARHEDLDAAMN
jgi:hypothetical protein